MRKWDQDSIVEAFENINLTHLDSFEKVVFSNTHEKVCVHCKLHGDYWITPKNYLKGHRCAKCAREYVSQSRLKDKEAIIKKANSVHNNKYNYELVLEKLFLRKKYKIICPIHGEFEQRMDCHLLGHECHKCSNSYQRTQDEVIEEFRQIHGDKYDYSKVDFKGMHIKITIICPIHGEFEQTPSRHISGRGCWKCGGSKKLTTQEFVEKANKVHNNYYNYAKTSYINSQTKVVVTCPIHGDFLITPNNHLKGEGCPICKMSSLERKVEQFLNDNRIDYLRQHKWEWLIHNRNMSVDFYLPKYNIAIECQGEQHFQPVDCFNGEEGFKRTTKRDELKFKQCNENNVFIYYIHNNLSNIEQIISNSVIYTKDNLIALDDIGNLLKILEV